jgi:hypothetical protein
MALHRRLAAVLAFFSFFLPALPLHADVSELNCAALLQGLPPGVPCHFNFSGFRPKDPRLTRLEQFGVLGSGLFPGKRLLAHDAAELKALESQVQPGDQIVLADGDWSNQKISFHADGTFDNPILIRPQGSAHPATFTGTASAMFWGSNLIVQNLNFRNGAIDTEKFTIMQLGGGVQRPCDWCIVNNLTIDDYNSAPAHYDDYKVATLVLQGQNITVANSSISNVKNVGTVIHGTHPVENQCPPQLVADGLCFQGLHLLHNRVSSVSKGHRRSLGGDMKDKIMEIGSGLYPTLPSYSLIEGNLFEYADGGTNTLSYKSSDIIIKDNYLHANLGSINLRSSNRALIINNVFDGVETVSSSGNIIHMGTGGVIVQGRDHWIYGNRFKFLIAPLNDFHMPVSASYAAYPELADGQVEYAQVRDLVVAHNTFEQSVEPPIALGTFPNTSRKRTTPPQDIYILQNHFINGGGVPGESVATQRIVRFGGDPKDYAGIHLANNMQGDNINTGADTSFLSIFPVPPPVVVEPPPVVVPPTPDVVPPTPDVVPPTPDVVPPTPDVVPPTPDVVPPTPDVVPPTPDVVPPTPDVVPPTPDVVPPTPDVVPPAPEVIPPTVLERRVNFSIAPQIVTPILQEVEKGYPDVSIVLLREVGKSPCVLLRGTSQPRLNAAALDVGKRIYRIESRGDKTYGIGGTSRK